MTRLQKMDELKMAGGWMARSNKESDDDGHGKREREREREERERERERGREMREKQRDERWGFNGISRNDGSIAMWSSR